MTDPVTYHPKAEERGQQQVLQILDCWKCFKQNITETNHHELGPFAGPQNIQLNSHTGTVKISNENKLMPYQMSKWSKVYVSP